jgi:cbb3-type cytochrome oxidase subunit 3
MFKKQWISLLFFWLILLCGLFWYFYNPSSEAKMAYQNLMKESDQIKTECKQKAQRPTQQTRYNVSKQILYQKDLQRLQSRLVSASSELIYSKGKGELVEHFKELTCVMQEKDAPEGEGDQAGQSIRRFHAKKAVYSYKSGQLDAEEVELAHYLMPGNIWPDVFESRPFLQGRARTLQLSLLEEPTVKAQGFQAVFQGEGEEW